MHNHRKRISLYIKFHLFREIPYRHTRDKVSRKKLHAETKHEKQDRNRQERWLRNTIKGPLKYRLGDLSSKHAIYLKTFPPNLLINIIIKTRYFKCTNI